MSTAPDLQPAPDDPRTVADSARRRTLVALAAAGASWGAPALAQPSQPRDSSPLKDVSTTRLALLIGNRAYPPPFDLPPTHKNVRDLAAALERRGFRVTSALDQDPAQLRATVQAFARQAASSPPDATVLYYFTGHGMQVDAENLMLGAGVAPNGTPDALLSASMRLQRDVVQHLPQRPSGLSIAVIDACRTSLLAALQAKDGLNQVEAPVGCLIVFSTGAGKPAIAPAVETLNTFYTASLVKLLDSASDDISFSDLFRLVKIDVTQTMQNHPIAAIRQFTQVPFIAENVQVSFPLSPRARTEATPVLSTADESDAWKQLDESYWPADVVKFAEAYLQKFPQSRLAGAAQVAREGAGDGVKALRSNDVRLFKSAFQPQSRAERWLAEWRKASRGDKDAAARIARAHLKGDGEIPADPNRYEGWLQYAAALGNGIASYELALYYRRLGQPAPAAKYETLARDLGYTPPTSLDNQRK